MDRKTILFIVSAILIWILYTEFVMPLFIKPQPIKPKQPVQPIATQTTEPSKPITPTGQTTIQNPTPAPAVSVNEVELQPDKVINNPFLTAVFTNKGAALKSLSLNKYKGHGGKDILLLLNTFQTDKLSLTLNRTGEPSTVLVLGEDLSLVNWHIISPTNQQAITFQCQTRDGLVITKQFSIHPDGYSLNYRVSIKNTQKTAVNTTFRFNGFAGINPEMSDRTDIKGIRAYRENETKWTVKEETDLKGLTSLEKEGKQRILQKGDNIPQKDNVIWTGLADKYFAAILIPANELTENVLIDYVFESLNDNVGFTTELDRRKKEGEQFDINTETELKNWSRNISFYTQTKQISIAPEGETNYDFIVYAGPKAKDTLEPLSSKGVDKIVSYGLFGFISLILLAILGFFYSILGNYGWAIIFLTVVVKVLLFPITKKGQVSAYKLQQIQPKIKALQEKYKNDKQKLGVEQIKLFKEYGVNPLSGCLPMLFQIPVFIGLYQALYYAIELRHAPFMFWINDLSQPDFLCKLPFKILGATDLHLLPLLMTVSWLIQSLTQPKSPDQQARQQQKIMTFMPMIFCIFFYNIPSGLTLYWFIQTLLGIVEQLIIKKVYFKQ